MLLIGARGRLNQLDFKVHLLAREDWADLLSEASHDVLWGFQASFLAHADGNERHYRIDIFMGVSHMKMIMTSLGKVSGLREVAQ